MVIKNFNHERLKNVRCISLTDDSNVNEFYANFLLEHNKIFSYLQEKDLSEAKSYLIDILKQKIEYMKKSSAFKNDGVMMPFLSFENIKKIYDVELLYLFSDSDLEKSKFGLDSVFVGENLLFLVEYKSRSNSCKEDAVENALEEATVSIFGKDSYDLSTLKYCRKNLDTINIKQPENILELLNYYKLNRNNADNLTDKVGLSFNVCIISPIDEFNIDVLEEHILKKYLNCNLCGQCKKYKCARYEKIKINDVVHIQLSNEFDLEQMYEIMLNKIEACYEEK